jgi:serine/threonine protein kinase
MKKIPLEQHMKSNASRSEISSDAIELLEKMLTYDSRKRITAQECLTHNYFNEVPFSIKQLGSNRHRQIPRNPMQTNAEHLLNKNNLPN